MNTLYKQIYRSFCGNKTRMFYCKDGRLYIVDKITNRMMRVNFGRKDYYESFMIKYFIGRNI